jgi:electron transport complex protein RnfG
MTLSPEEDSTITSASRILRQGKNDGFCLQVEPMGFGGAITMIVGVDGQGAVLGVEIVELSETPGLGAKADDVKWLAQYQGASGSLNVVKAATGNPGDITALSGATITSKGVTAGVQTALDFAARQ